MSRGPTTNAKAFLTVSVWREETVFPNDAQFKMVNPTDYALTKFQHLAETDERDHVEVSPESGIIVQKISQRVSDHGGRALIIDYGHEGTKKDTFRVKQISAGFSHVWQLSYRVCAPNILIITLTILQIESTSHYILNRQLRIRKNTFWYVHVYWQSLPGKSKVLDYICQSRWTAFRRIRAQIILHLFGCGWNIDIK